MDIMAAGGIEPPAQDL